MRSTSLQVVGELPEKLASSSDGEALGSEWFRVEIAAIHELVNKAQQRSHVRIPCNNATRFLGFVEGRLRVELPFAWQQCILNGTLLANGFFAFPSQEYSPWNENADECAEVSFPVAVPTPESLPTMRVYVEGEDIHLSVVPGTLQSAGREGRLTIPREVSATFPLDPDATAEDAITAISSALFYNNDVFIAVMSDAPVSGSLYCISNATRQVKWKRPIVIIGEEMNWKGVIRWYTQLRIRDELLIMFHCCELGIGIEGIGVDGTPLFSFSSVPRSIGAERGQAGSEPRGRREAGDEDPGGE